MSTNFCKNLQKKKTACYDNLYFHESQPMTTSPKIPAYKHGVHLSVRRLNHSREMKTKTKPC